MSEGGVLEVNRFAVVAVLSLMAFTFTSLSFEVEDLHGSWVCEKDSMGVRRDFAISPAAESPFLWIVQTVWIPDWRDETKLKPSTTAGAGLLIPPATLVVFFWLDDCQGASTSFYRVRNANVLERYATIGIMCLFEDQGYELEPPGLDSEVFVKQ